MSEPRASASACDTDGASADIRIARHAAQADRLLRLRDGAVVEEQALTRSRSLSQVLGELGGGEEDE